MTHSQTQFSSNYRENDFQIADLIKKSYFLLFCLLILSCNGTQHGMTSRPYLSQVAEDSIVVSWQTSVPTASVVEYGETASYGYSVRSDKATRFHSIAMTGLKPSREYHYSVLSSEKTQDYTFRTAVKPGESFTFAVYGDTQPDNENHLRILRLIMKSQPLFIINMGDLVQEDKVYAWNDYLYEICDRTDLGETIPIYSVIGNHDDGDHGAKALYFKYLSLPSNNPERTEAYYSFNIGDAHFIALDSYLPCDPGSSQYRWLEEDLKGAANHKWKIVFLHVPLYSSGKHGSDIKARMDLSPLFEKGHVALVFAGHDHIYERTESMKGITYIVTGGGGAPLYDVTKTAWSAAIDKTHHFCKVQIEGNQCEVTMIRADGTTGDRFVVTK